MPRAQVFHQAPPAAPRRRARCASGAVCGRAIGKAHRADPREESGAAKIAVARSRPGPAAASAGRSGRRPRRRANLRRPSGPAPAPGAGGSGRRPERTSSSTTRSPVAAPIQRHHPSGQMRDHRPWPGPAPPPALRAAWPAAKPSTSAASKRQTAARGQSPSPAKRAAPAANSASAIQPTRPKRRLDRPREIERRARAQRHRQPQRPAVPLGQRRLPIAAQSRAGPGQAQPDASPTPRHQMQACSHRRPFAKRSPP